MPRRGRSCNDWRPLALHLLHGSLQRGDLGAQSLDLGREGRFIGVRCRCDCGAERHGGNGKTRMSHCIFLHFFSIRRRRRNATHGGIAVGERVEEAATSSISAALDACRSWHVVGVDVGNSRPRQ
jgi:hypothetical protein